MKSSGYQSGQQRTIMIVGGIIVLALIGIGMIWIGFRLDRAGRSKDQQSSPTATSAMAGIQPPTSQVIVPTVTPLPTATAPLPTDTPQPTPVPEPMIVAQEGGVNLRSGPGATFSQVGRLEGGASARVTGKYADWWQIDYGGTPAWVANWVVADSNTGGVPEVAPPASPIPPVSAPPTAVPATAAPTAVPATAVPDTRGIVSDRFDVGTEGLEVKAPGPFGNAGDIWFYMQVSNTTAGDITLAKWGAFVEETGDFQMSYGGPDGGKPLKVDAGKTCQHDDHINQFTLPEGTYHLWQRVCFQDGYCVNIDGPVEIRIG